MPKYDISREVRILPLINAIFDLHLLHMKKIHLVVSIFSLSIISLAFNTVKRHNSGEVGATGSPGEGTCSGCHGGGAAGTTISVTASPSFTNNTYDPGITYSITLTVAHPSQGAFGFDCEILNSTNTNAGTMSNAGAGASLANAFNGRRNIKHTTKKSGSGSASWTFEWTPPVSGDVTFYIAENAVNSNNSTSGDSPAATSFTLGNSIGTGITTSASKENILISISPNPASELIRLNYMLTHKCRINAELIDISGKTVKVLMDEDVDTGAQSKILSINGINSGVYFIKVYSDGVKVSQKLICIQ